MEEPLALEDITGLTLTMAGVLIEQYVQEGYSDPTMYRFLKAAGELADQFKARAEVDGAPEQFIQGIAELSDNIKLTAMQSGEIVQRIIDENGWQDETQNWDRPTTERRGEK